MKIPIVVLLSIIIILCLALLFYVFFWKGYSTYRSSRLLKEGLGSITYPESVSNLRLIYDTLYFDTDNANVLDLSSNLDSNGVITSYLSRKIYSRDKGNTVDNVKYDISSSVISKTAAADTISSSYDKYSIATSQKCQFFYIAWDNDTYIHVIDLEYPISATQKEPRNVMTFCYDKTGSPRSVKKNPYTNSTVSINTQSYMPNITDGKTSVLSKYDTKKTIYKIVTGIYYDMVNGSLILEATSGYNVYERKAQTASGCSTPTPVYIPATAEDKTGTSTSIVDVGFCSWVVQQNDFLVVYIGNGKKTMIMILNKQTNSNEYSILTFARFLANGTLDDGTSVDGRNIVGGSLDFDINNYFDIDYIFNNRNGRGGDTNNPLSDYYRWANYWNQQSGDERRLSRNDYMLKTQIVPPVCPRCPSCPSSGVCGTCGGNGGSGTQVKDSKDEDKGEGKRGILEKTGSGVKDLLEDTGSGAKDLLEDTGTGVKDLAYDTASGVKDVAYDVVGGTKDVAYDVAGGVRGLFQTNPTQLGSGQQQQQQVNEPGQYQQPPDYRMTGSGPGYGINANIPQTEGSDFMTYFGALQPKGSANYIPVTADFSSFRK